MVLMSVPGVVLVADDVLKDDTDGGGVAIVLCRDMVEPIDGNCVEFKLSGVGRNNSDAFIRLRDSVVGGDTCRLFMLLRGYRQARIE